MIEVKIELLDPRSEQIAAQWRQLEKQARVSFFVSWDWVSTVLSTPPAECSFSLLRLSNDGETVGLAYICEILAFRHLLVCSRQIHFNSPGIYLFIEDNALVARPDLGASCWQAVMEWFLRKQQADEFVLPGLQHPLDLTHLNLRNAFRNDTVVRSYHVDLSQLEASNGRFADLLSKNARYQLRKSLRDYGGSNDLQIIEASSPEEALNWFDDMKILHIDSWRRRGKAHAFALPFFETFHRNLIRRTFPSGRIQMLRATAGGTPIGYLYNFRDGFRTYAYQSGFLDKERRLRPGAVCHALAIEHNFRLGVQVYDFMAGANRLKISFSTGHRDMYWSTVQLPRLRFRFERLARTARRQLISLSKDS